MIIKENWFYMISNISSWEIVVWEWVVAYFFDDWKNNVDVYLWKNSYVEFYGLLNSENNHNISFYQNEFYSKLKVNYLLMSFDNSIKSKIYSKTSSDNSEVDIKILSLVWENWNIDIDGIVEIDEWYKKIKWHLLEENIFLANTWKIRWVPTLLVRSDDVEASHACKIERINDDELFYLRSRGLNRNDSLNIILESKIKVIFSCLSMIDKWFHQELLENIINLLTEKMTNN